LPFASHAGWRNKNQEERIKAKNASRGIDRGGFGGGVIVNEPKTGPSQFKAEIERLQREGKLPSLEEVLEVVVKVRAEFAAKILAARRGKKERGAR
jgi:hypothetical protein